MSDLWTSASIDHEGEQHRARLLAARRQLTPVVAFLVASENPSDYTNRKAVVADRVQAAVLAAVGEEDAELLAAVEASLDADYSVVHQAQVRERIVAETTRRMALRKAAEEESTCSLCGAKLIKTEDGWADDNDSSDRAFDCPKAGGDNGPHIPSKTSARRTAGDDEGGSKCAECGASIERDPEGEEPRTWHHNDGESHDHEAKPSGDSKESSKTAGDFKCARCSKPATHFAFEEGARASGMHLCGEHAADPAVVGDRKVEKNSEGSRRIAGRYCKTHQVWVGEGNADTHTGDCKVEDKTTEESKESSRHIAANPYAKSRPAERPYEIWTSFDGSWEWHVLKKWQTDDSKPAARWFCLVKTPYVPSGELGDVYVAEIKGNATMTYRDATVASKIAVEDSEKSKDVATCSCGFSTANDSAWQEHIMAGSNTNQFRKGHERVSLRRRHAAEGAQTCSTCGDSIEKDPAGEDPQTWHHNNGEKHDHEAKPGSDSKEGHLVQMTPRGRLPFEGDLTAEGVKIAAEGQWVACPNRGVEQGPGKLRAHQQACEGGGDKGRDSDSKFAVLASTVRHAVNQRAFNAAFEAMRKGAMPLDESGRYRPETPFNGRTPTAVCSTCGESIAQLSPREWVDGLDNKASDSPEWHEHKPTSGQSTGMRKGAPFAGYKDFDACVKANSDKRDPEAYCGKIKHEVEDKKAARTARHTDTCPKCGEHMDDVMIHGDVLVAKCSACGWSGTKKKTAMKATCRKCGKTGEGDDAFSICPSCGVGADDISFDKTAGFDGYWAAIDAALNELRTATTPEEAISVIHRSNGGHTSSGEAFWGGDGDDLLGALLGAHWRIHRYEAPYYWVLKAPNGRLLSYTEGDVSKGDNPSVGPVNSKRTAAYPDDDSVWEELPPLPGEGPRIVCRHGRRLDQGCHICLSDDDWHVEGVRRVAALAVNTWADGFGNWHAEVTEGNNAVGDSAAAEAAALAAIRAELSQREGPSFAPDVVGVKLVSRTSRDGNLVSEYVETNAHEGVRRVASDSPGTICPYCDFTGTNDEVAAHIDSAGPKHQEGGSVSDQANTKSSRRTASKRLQVAQDVVDNGIFDDAGKTKKLEGVILDLGTASLMVQVYDALSPANQAKFDSIPLQKLVDLCWKHSTFGAKTAGGAPPWLNKGKDDKKDEAAPATEEVPVVESEFEPGQAVTLNYTLANGTAGSLPGTFKSVQGGEQFFECETGEFAVTQQGSDYVDAQGTKFTIEASEQVAEPAAPATPAIPAAPVQARRRIAAKMYKDNYGGPDNSPAAIYMEVAMGDLSDKVRAKLGERAFHDAGVSNLALYQSWDDPRLKTDQITRFIGLLAQIDDPEADNAIEALKVGLRRTAAAPKMVKTTPGAGRGEEPETARKKEERRQRAIERDRAADAEGEVRTKAREDKKRDNQGKFAANPYSPGAGNPYTQTPTRPEDAAGAAPTPANESLTSQPLTTRPRQQPGAETPGIANTEAPPVEPGGHDPNNVTQGFASLVSEAEAFLTAQGGPR